MIVFLRRNSLLFRLLCLLISLLTLSTLYCACNDVTKYVESAGRVVFSRRQNYRQIEGLQVRVGYNQNLDKRFRLNKTAKHFHYIKLPSPLMIYEYNWFVRASKYISLSSA